MLNAHSTIRERNVHIVLSEIINQPEISRAQIAEQTGLNKATVSEIVRELIEEQYVIEIGRGESSSIGGRKPILLKINKKAGLSFSFDVRYDKISYMISYLDGAVLETHSKDMFIDKQNIVSTIERMVTDYRKTMKNTPFNIIGIAIAVHGIVSDNKILFTPYYDLSQMNLAKSLSEVLDVPVYIENEANLAALAEATFVSHYNHLVTCSIHSGVGAGIIINQELYRGFEGRSGEIGHTTLYPGGIACPCGNYGCFEQYCSQRSLVNFYRKAKGDSSLTVEHLIAGYHADDFVAKNLIKEFAKNLSIGLSTLMGSYGPEAIYINSKIVIEIPEILEMMQVNLSQTLYKDFPLYISMLGEKASLYGATVLNIQNFLEIDSLDFSVAVESIL